MFGFLKKYTSPFRLNRAGIMGMNRRNISYIGRYNKRSLFPLVDNKLKTKRIAQKAGATVPELIGVLSEQHEVPSIHNMVKEWPGFVIKPAQALAVKAFWLSPRTKTVFIKSRPVRRSARKKSSAISPTPLRACSPSAGRTMWPWWKT